MTHGDLDLERAAGQRLRPVRLPDQLRRGQWLKEKVLLPPTTTKCAVPKEAAGQGMLRAIAYGTELNMAYPPRPTDPKIAWEPDWNVKIRVKSMTTTHDGHAGRMPEWPARRTRRA